MNNQPVSNSTTVSPHRMSTDNLTPAPESTTKIVQFPTSPLDLPVEQFSGGLQRREENRRALLSWINDNLVSWDRLRKDPRIRP